MIYANKEATVDDLYKLIHSTDLDENKKDLLFNLLSRSQDFHSVGKNQLLPFQHFFNAGFTIEQLGSIFRPFWGLANLNALLGLASSPVFITHIKQAGITNQQLTELSMHPNGSDNLKKLLITMPGKQQSTLGRLVNAGLTSQQVIDILKYCTGLTTLQTLADFFDSAIPNLAYSEWPEEVISLASREFSAPRINLLNDILLNDELRQALDSFSLFKALCKGLKDIPVYNLDNLKFNSKQELQFFCKKIIAEQPINQPDMSRKRSAIHFFSPAPPKKPALLVPPELIDFLKEMRDSNVTESTCDFSDPSFLNKRNVRNSLNITLGITITKMKNIPSIYIVKIIAKETLYAWLEYYDSIQRSTEDLSSEEIAQCNTIANALFPEVQANLANLNLHPSDSESTLNEILMLINSSEPSEPELNALNPMSVANK